MVDNLHRVLDEFHREFRAGPFEFKRDRDGDRLSLRLTSDS
jgi:hypothetical protein